MKVGIGNVKATPSAKVIENVCPCILAHGTTANPFVTVPWKSSAIDWIVSAGNEVTGVPVSKINCVLSKEGLVGPENPNSTISILQKPSPAVAPFTYCSWPLFIIY